MGNENTEGMSNTPENTLAALRVAFPVLTPPRVDYSVPSWLRQGAALVAKGHLTALVMATLEVRNA